MADTIQQDDTRAAVEAAMQHHEAAGEVAAPTSAVEAPTVDATPTTETAPPRARDEGGRFAQKAEEKKPAATPGRKVEAAPEKAEAATQGEQKPQEPARPAPPKSAPLPAAVREDWEKIPESTRQYILKREGEVSRVLSETAGARKTHAELSKTLEPYRDLLTDEPMKVVSGLLQTAAVLKRGSPAEKTQVLSQVLSGYAVDKTELAAQIILEQGVDIEALAARLERGGPPPQQAPAPYRDPRVDSIEQRLAREDMARQQQARQYAATKYKEFSENAEFLDTPGVREAMEREMVAAAQRGVALEYQDAYDRAVWAIEDTREVLLSRRQQGAQAGTAQDKAAIQRAKAAGSSVRTDPVPGRVTTDNSVEANIRALLG